MQPAERPPGSALPGCIVGAERLSVVGPAQSVPVSLSIRTGVSLARGLTWAGGL